MALKGKLTISGRVFEVTTQGDNEKVVSEMLKNHAYEILHEEILDECKGWNWSIKQSNKMREQIDDAIIVWS
jgi:hypothetical protein